MKTLQEAERLFKLLHGLSIQLAEIALLVSVVIGLLGEELFASRAISAALKLLARTLWLD
jgi:hypothetical protein